MAITISGNGITSANIADGTITTDDINASDVTSLKSGRKNLIINGAMQVAQRGTSSTGITTGGYYTTDRFNNSMNALGTWTSEQSTDAPDGFAFSHKVTCTTADTPVGSDYFRLITRFEGQDMQHLAFGTSSAKSLTLSFWVKSSNTGTFNCMIRNHNTTQSRCAGGLITISAADTWEYKTITVSGDTSYSVDNNNGQEFNIELWFNAGSTYSGTDISTTWSNFSADKYYGTATLGLGNTINDYLNITGLQLELGDTATDFEHRSYGEELALCQRYYWKIGDSASRTGFATCAAHTTSAAFGIMHFPVTMRTTPSYTRDGSYTDYYLTGNNGQRTITAHGVEGMNKNGVTLSPSASSLSVGHSYWFNNVNTNGTFSFDAEL